MSRETKLIYIYSELCSFKTLGIPTRTNVYRSRSFMSDELRDGYMHSTEASAVTLL